jgi:hypothetical protein
LAPAFPPPRPEQSKEVGREHRIAVTAPLAALDTDQHPLAVDVDHLERRHFGDPQPGAISDAQRGAVLVMQVDAASSRATSSGLSTVGSLRG